MLNDIFERKREKNGRRRRKNWRRTVTLTPLHAILKGRGIRADSNEMAEAIFGLCKPLYALFKHNEWFIY
jgi:uncharacterized membrane protein